MTQSPEYLANRLREEGAKMMEYFNQLTPAQWEARIYPQDGEWTFHHLLAHFVSAERGRRELISNILSGGVGVPDDFDTQDYNRDEVELLVRSPVESLMSQFLSERSKIISIVSGMQSLDLERIGKDPFLGQAPLAEIIKLTYRHLQIHMREVRSYL